LARGPAEDGLTQPTHLTQLTATLHTMPHRSIPLTTTRGLTPGTHGIPGMDTRTASPLRHVGALTCCSLGSADSTGGYALSVHKSHRMCQSRIIVLRLRINPCLLLNTSQRDLLGQPIVRVPLGGEKSETKNEAGKNSSLRRLRLSDFGTIM